MSIRVTLLPGDGIGPEVSLAMKKCVDASGAEIEWEEHPVGEYAIQRFGTPLPEAAIESVRRNKIAIKGPIVTPVGAGFRSVNVHLRQVLDLFACVRPARYYEGTKAVNQKVDLVIFRENTEDLYAGIEFEQGGQDVAHLIEEINRMQPKPIRADSAISIKPISITCSRRIVKSAFDYAVKNNRKKVSAVHKANIMKYTDGLFLQVARDVAKDYEGKVEFEDVIVDNMCMQLVQKPELYDVLVLPNLYGDIISDLCAGLVGGLGIAPGANIGEDAALFEPVHGSAPKYAGKNKVNPTATILSAVMMLRYMNKTREADRLEQAVRDVLREGKSVTYDLKLRRDDPSAVGTQEMAEAICQKLR
ncbi:MAG TPA: isocitrate/isopropylmalate dehydrogenase family protein [Candidatus Omnitrophota bacterium]|jgi:isocitrate dehydrogenase (NAD+)|nr:isocitrate/isopropylmalate dehydrogenase family protein [Candidatus Omnitrophota bacterium]HPN56441.1 isocitrate/isopropylmalate dehydrogenase family protein [Candidatus Omnitrophota bacterium]